MSTITGRCRSGRRWVRRGLFVSMLIVSGPVPSVAADGDGKPGVTLEPAPPRFGFKPVESGTSFRPSNPTRRQTRTEILTSTPYGVVPKAPSTPQERAAAVMSPPGRAERLPDVTTFGRTPIATRSGSIAGARGPSRGFRAPRARR